MSRLTDISSNPTLREFAQGAAQSAIMPTADFLAPTVEVAFLNGNQAPTLTQEDTSTILGVDFTAFIDATAKALDFRGLYRNTGA